MDLQETALLIKKYAPNNYKDVQIVTEGVKHELEETIKILGEELRQRQNNNDFKSMHEMVNLQESISNYIATLNNLCNTDGHQKVSSPKDNCNTKLVKKKQSRHCNSPILDTDWYDIDENNVTFKDLQAITFRHRTYRLSSWTSFYLTICNLLYKENPAIIESLVQNKEPGIKIVKNNVGLLAGRKINGCNLWLEVHGNAEKIKKSIIRLLDLYHIPYHQVKVLYADRRKNTRRV